MGQEKGLFNTSIVNDASLNSSHDKLFCLHAHFYIVEALTYIGSTQYLNIPDIIDNVKTNAGIQRMSSTRITQVSRSVEELHDCKLLIKKPRKDEYRLNIPRIKIVEEAITKLSKLKQPK